ncbi:hypothetical protein N7467_005996 [Penicillium canescens]|nr:hypothetical protein N7467_005996 [Penicillium canescens]
MKRGLCAVPKINTLADIAPQDEAKICRKERIENRFVMGEHAQPATTADFHEATYNMLAAKE